MQTHIVERDATVRGVALLRHPGEVARAVGVWRVITALPHADARAARQGHAWRHVGPYKPRVI